MKQIALHIYRSLRRPVNRLLNQFDPPVVVLLYHRVTAIESDPEMLAVTPDRFRAQMRYLKEAVPVVRFEEDWSQLTKPAVAITFDDGYADNALEALPILEEVGIPATFFISTGAINTTRDFWWHEIERIILGGKKLPAEFTLQEGRSRKTWPTSTDTERRALYHELVRVLTDADAGRRDVLLSELRDWSRSEPSGANTHRAMTLEELRSLAESEQATIGAHTVNHIRLSSLPPSEQEREICDSKRQLETWLNREITVFSYPFGKRHDYTKETVALCRAAGYAKAATNVPGQAHRWTAPYRIPRLLVRNWPVEIFVEMLENFWIK